MKKFNKDIEVKVSVDAIADKLLSQLDSENPHSEMIAETVIGSMLESGHISLLYNNLNGWTNELNFKVGDTVNCNAKVYQFIEQATAEPTPNVTTKEVYIEVGECQIIDINVFKKAEIKVEFTKHNRDGSTQRDAMWVSKVSIAAISTEE